MTKVIHVALGGGNNKSFRGALVEAINLAHAKGVSSIWIVLPRLTQLEGTAIECFFGPKALRTLIKDRKINGHGVEFKITSVKHLKSLGMDDNIIVGAHLNASEFENEILNIVNLQYCFWVPALERDARIWLEHNEAVIIKT